MSYKKGDRVVVTIKVRGKGKPGGWIDCEVPGTVLSVQKRVKVKLDRFCFGLEHWVSQERLEHE